MSKFFGTDGIRGKVGGEVINQVFAYKLGRALVDYCLIKNFKPLIIIGRDTRESGPLLELAVSQGIASRRGRAVSAGVITTPGISFTVKKRQAGLGLMISASHNPAEDNGFKIFKGDGVKLTDAEERDIEDLLVKTEPDPGPENSAAGPETAVECVDEYGDFLINSAVKDFSGMKIVLDCAHGATFKIAPRAFKKLGAEVITMFDQPDGKNINADCGSQFTENLAAAVIKHRADVGLAFDGDGDRLIAITEKGQPVTGDHLLYIFSKMFLANDFFEKKVIVSTAMSNLGFIKALNDLGLSHAMVAEIGDRPVLFEMVKQGAILGGEESGHIIFSRIIKAGDGILSGLMLAQAIRHFDQPLSALAGQLNLYPKVLLNVPVRQKPDLTAIPEISQAVRQAEEYFGKDGRVFIRYSGTEPLCRVMIEGREEKAVNVYAKKLAEIIEARLNH